jgi:hypothetical protein
VVNYERLQLGLGLHPNPDVMTSNLVVRRTGREETAHDVGRRRQFAKLSCESARNNCRLWLAQQHTAARTISGLAIILSALLFAPADFAAFGIFLAILNQTGLLLFLRYDTLLISAETEVEFQSAICLNIGVLGVSLSIISAASAMFVAMGLITPLFAVLFVAALASRGTQRILSGIATRFGAFRLIGQNSMIHAVSLPVTILLAYFFGVNGAVAMSWQQHFCADTLDLLFAPRQTEQIASHGRWRWPRTGQSCQGSICRQLFWP